MNCLQALQNVDDLVDGLLDDPGRAGTEAHLAACASCAEEARKVRSLLQRASRLPESIEPYSDLWDRIAFRLDRHRTPVSLPAVAERPRPTRRSWLRPSLAAASVLLVAGTALAMMLMMGRRAEQPDLAGTPPAVPVVPAAASPAPATLPAGLAAAEVAFYDARQKLRAELYSRRESLSPATLHAVNENLRIIEDAITQIQAALAADPGNRELKRLLIASRHREVDLLQQVTQTAALRKK